MPKLLANPSLLKPRPQAVSTFYTYYLTIPIQLYGIVNTDTTVITVMMIIIIPVVAAVVGGAVAVVVLVAAAAAAVLPAQSYSLVVSLSRWSPAAWICWATWRPRRVRPRLPSSWLRYRGGLQTVGSTRPDRTPGP